jgi:hypothetical protein
MRMKLVNKNKVRILLDDDRGGCKLFDDKTAISVTSSVSTLYDDKTAISVTSTVPLSRAADQ